MIFVTTSEIWERVHDDHDDDDDEEEDDDGDDAPEGPGGPRGTSGPGGPTTTGRRGEAPLDGAAMHPSCDEASARVTRAACLMQFVAKFPARTLRANGPPTTAPSSREVAARDGRRRKVQQLSADVEPEAGVHDLAEYQGRVRCLRCLRVAKA